MPSHQVAHGVTVLHVLCLSVGLVCLRAPCLVLRSADPGNRRREKAADVTARAGAPMES